MASLNTKNQCTKNQAITLDLFISKNRLDRRLNSKCYWKLFRQQLLVILEKENVKPSKGLRIHCVPLSNNGFIQIIVQNIKTNYKKILYCLLQFTLTTSLVLGF